MKKKTMNIINCIFSILFLLIIFVPFCMLDTTEIIDSELENRRMTMWPGWHFNKEINEWYGHYVEDRVGFREDAVRLYTNAVYDIFGEFTEDLHMYGKNEEIFPADREYVRAYQNLATDEQLIDSLVTYLDRTDAYLEEQGIAFAFVAGLDKKTVYGEYMPDYIRVDESKEGIMEMLSRKLTDAGVPYVIPIEEYAQAKKNDKIYNRIYDTAHWNALGAMECIRLLDEEIWKQNDAIVPVSEDAYVLGYEEKRLDNSCIDIREKVPVYTLKPEYADTVWQNTETTAQLEGIGRMPLMHMENSEALSNQSILIMHDSFLDNKTYYFTYRYKDVYMVSRHDYECMQQYVEILEPDVVVFEVAERAFVDDLHAYVNLANVTYE